MADGKQDMRSLEERENLMVDRTPHYSGFTPRSIQRLTQRHRPHTMTDIECCHFLRTPTREFTHQHPSVEHRLWVEAGKPATPFPARPDTSYNSNIWRNFRREYGLSFKANDRKVSEVIASMYPLNIPAASQVRENTFEKYVRETKLFQDEKGKSLAIRRSKTEVSEFKKLRCKTEARNPPLNERGDILPPDNYKKYAHRFVPVPSPPPSPPPKGQKTDLFGQRYTPRSKPVLWKLSYKLNHPEYRKLREEVARRREIMEQLKGSNSQSLQSLPRVMPSPMIN
ncbi:hypothetical protein RRG08_027555 [Elysia crispata]|uniref:Uncharacterized protein n=1 Tax=Elysia crispata TaxID=231223 RepID=A0AAE1BC49_9GAST|nr:hypothetical protein RRG08_027555 [Elysia crispata]